MNCNDNYEKEPENFHENILNIIQKKCRELQLIYEKVKNREMELAIINLQQAAHWAYHGIMRHHAEKKKDE